MWIIIVILLVIGMIVGYVQGLTILPEALQFIFMFLFVSFLTVSVCILINKLCHNMSREEKRRLQQAKRKDERNSAENEARRAEQYSVYMKDSKVKQSKLYEEIVSIKDRISEAQSKVNSSRILGSKEKNINAIDYIIEQMESNRADSVKEALHLYDAYQERTSRFYIQQFENEMRRQEENRRYEEEARQNRIHQQKLREIEDEKRRTLDEINRKLDR